MVPNGPLEARVAESAAEGGSRYLSSFDLRRHLDHELEFVEGKVCDVTWLLCFGFSFMQPPE